MSVDEHRAAVSISEYLRVGWLQRLPHSAFSLYEAVLRMEDEGLVGELDAQPSGSRVAETLASTGGLAADPFAWYEGEVDVSDSEGQELLDDIRAELRRAEASVGLQVHTNADLLELMRRLGLVERVHAFGQATWRPVRPIPLPEERLLLTATERAREDELRWRGEHEQNANAVFGLFGRDDVDVLRASLNELALRLELPVESVREAVLVLLTEDAYSTVIDVETLDATVTFELRLDWNRWWEDHGEPEDE